MGPSSPAGIGAPLAIATAVELPLPIQHRLEIAALEAGHQPVVGASLVPGEKEKTSELATVTRQQPLPGQAPTEAESALSH